MITQVPIFSRFLPGLETLCFKKFVQTLRQEMIPLEIVDLNGKKVSTIKGRPRHRLVIKDKKFFSALISPNAFSLGDAYIKGYFDIKGSIRELYEMACRKLLSTDQPKGLFTCLANLFTDKKRKEKQNIRYHYDVPSGFYELFLGETMGYTCGYYATPETGMSDAQIEKMDIICRKLRLKETDHLLDIGCGWGNFAVYAAEHYGVRVTGITLSREQKAFAEKWAGEKGLSDNIEIRLMNYRDLEGETFDKISCIGMSEHVGRPNMKGFYTTVFKSLKPDGLFLQHTITTNLKPKIGHKNSFLDTYMFPGGELMFQQDLIDLAAGTGFELLNADNFRLHYVRTLKDWIDRMESRRDKILQIVSEHVYRIYHVFFIGSMISFRQNEIALFQNLFYKSGDRDDRTDYFITPYSKNETRIA